MAYEMKMVILRSRQRYGECVTLVEQWIDCCPEREEAYLGLGELWLFLDQNQKALEIFSQLLTFSHHNCMAQIGLAQAQVRLGQDFVSTLMKASVWDSRYTKEMVEHSFDFRTTRPDDLVPMTLEAVAEHFMIPLKRIMGRALRGVLPFHRKSGSDLLLFSEAELRNYYKVLKSLGLEMATRDVSSEPLPREPEAFQPSLFDEYDEAGDP
jgi:tetratricopeptide (TPR) repeat protein